jgi:hypothetical protein
MRVDATIGVRAIAAELGVNHAVISRRIAKLKSTCVVGFGSNGWEVAIAIETDDLLSPWPAAPTTRWLKPINSYGRQFLKEVDDDDGEERENGKPARKPRHPRCMGPCDSSVCRFG